MNQVDNQIEIVKMSYRITNPWKVNAPGGEYTRGWNDCLKAIKKAQKEHLKRLEILARSFDKVKTN